MKAKLPRFLKFKTASDLIRLGRNHDGGYLVSKRDVETSDILIGLGINDDWSFEKDFSSRNNVPIVAYDASVNKKFFLRQILKSIVLFDNPKLILSRLKTYLSYSSFFRGSHTHVQKFVGLKFNDKFVSMEDVFATTSSKNIFLKIDIEGSEYRILDDLLKEQEKITGIVIEFHDCDLHLTRIKRFVENIKIPIVHIHANNYSLLVEEGGLPLVIELTFSREASLKGNFILPNPLDMPNTPSREEIILHFD